MWCGPCTTPSSGDVPAGPVRPADTVPRRHPPCAAAHAPPAQDPARAPAAAPPAAPGPARVPVRPGPRAVPAVPPAAADPVASAAVALVAAVAAAAVAAAVSARAASAAASAERRVIGIEAGPPTEVGGPAFSFPCSCPETRPRSVPACIPCLRPDGRCR